MKLALVNVVSFAPVLPAQKYTTTALFLITLNGQFKL